MQTSYVFHVVFSFGFSCIGRRSNGQYDSPFFAYRVRIENRNDPSISDTTVQLLGREWKIYDDEKNIINFVDFPNAGAGKILYIHIFFKLLI